MLQECILCNHPLSIGNALYNFLLKCPACGFVVRKDPPTEDTSLLYSEEYFTNTEYKDYLNDKDILQDNFRKYIRKIRCLSKGDKLLEIGCAYGLFLKEATKFWNAQGIDISASAVRYAKETLNLNVQCGDFLQVSYPQNDLDVICMWDTIEHLYKPHLYLSRCSDILKSGGIVCITTGDIGSINARLRGRKWRILHQPTHIFFFSKSTIRKMLSKYGFNLISFSYIGQKRRLSTLLHQIAQQSGSLLKKRVLECLSKSPLAQLSVSINLQDIMFIVGRKV